MQRELPIEEPHLELTYLKHAHHIPQVNDEECVVKLVLGDQLRSFTVHAQETTYEKQKDTYLCQIYSAVLTNAGLNSVLDKYKNCGGVQTLQSLRLCAQSVCTVRERLHKMDVIPCPDVACLRMSTRELWH